ncbi:hypothetical protein [Tenacibaculum larymnensis]|uniref:Death domain-containing protein n=1 Tax=Tenacibaculum larymnensis TaxID=2878201 RepID=A0A9X4ETC8_9FLAO|nr:hypothetical protein [Tenacibaculum larymnensis]MDE1207915.1 hypothetical protein [Tenacibaculum larymnensis]
MKTSKLFFILIFITSFFLSCSSLKTAPYDQYSFQKTIEIKIDANQLIEKAENSYQDNIKEIEELQNEITKIVEYEKYKPNNEITYKMWLLLADKDKKLLAGFLKRWKEKGKLSPFFITEAKGQITEALNLLLEYESKKEPTSKNQLLQLLSNN